jgi:pyruvate kinase
VLVGGQLSERKGVSVVGAVLPVSALTEKDRRDLDFALELGADWVALSFVQRPEDLDEVRAIAGTRVPLMTKLAKPSAVARLEEIVARSEAVMIARGDLGSRCAGAGAEALSHQASKGCFWSQKDGPKSLKLHDSARARWAVEPSKTR